ncbi:MAG: hypothetical protein ACXVA9_02195 [Bdellovibrionales bacterium]
MNLMGALILSLAMATSTAQADTLVVPRSQATAFKPASPAKTRTASAPKDEGVMESDLVVVRRPNTNVATPAAPPVTATKPSAPVTPVAQPPAPVPPQVRPSQPPVSLAPPAPAEPAKRNFQGCTSKLDEVKSIVKENLGIDMLDSKWLEDSPKDGTGKSALQVVASDPVMIDMYSGKGQDMGRTRVTICAAKGKVWAKVKINGLSFPFGVQTILEYRLARSQDGDSANYILDLSKGAKGKVHIADRMTSYDTRIDSDFSAVSR